MKNLNKRTMLIWNNVPRENMHIRDLIESLVTTSDEELVWNSVVGPVRSIVWDSVEGLIAVSIVENVKMLK